MRFIRRLKRTTRQYITVAFICIAVIGTAAIATSAAMIGQIRQEYENMLGEARQEMDDNKKTVLAALSDIKTGELLSEDMVEEKTVYSSQPGESYITKDDLGKAAIIDIPAGTHIIKSMVAKSDVSPSLREVVYEVFHISSNIEANDFADIRILYPNGESYIVLSKKQLKGYQPDMPVCYLWVDEEELLRMSAAIVDAALYTGSILYMTKYIEPNIQEASVVTYTPSISVLNLIEHDPNIVERCSQLLNIEVRKALENRLAESMDKDVKNINWDVNGEIRYMPEAAVTPKNAGNIEENNTISADNINPQNDTKEKEIEAFDSMNEKNENTGFNIEENEFIAEDQPGFIKDAVTEAGADNDNKEILAQPDISYNPELGQLRDLDYFSATEG